MRNRTVGNAKWTSRYKLDFKHAASRIAPDCQSICATHRQPSQRTAQALDGFETLTRSYPAAKDPLWKQWLSVDSDFKPTLWQDSGRNDRCRDPIGCVRFKCVKWKLLIIEDRTNLDELSVVTTLSYLQSCQENYEWNKNGSGVTK